MMVSTATGRSGMHSGPTTGDDVGELVAAARSGDRGAWRRLIERYTPLVNGVARGYRLPAADVEDVTQTVWLKCLQNLGNLRDARALPGWLKTTAQNEAMRLLNSRNRLNPVGPEVLDHLLDSHPQPAEAATELLKEEVVWIIQRGLDELSPGERRLLVLLHAQSKPSYRDISRDLGIPTGSIGPSRARYLRKLRLTAAVSSYLDQDQLTLGA